MEKNPKSHEAIPFPSIRYSTSHQLFPYLSISVCSDPLKYFSYSNIETKKIRLTHTWTQIRVLIKYSRSKSQVNEETMKLLFRW